MAFQVELSQDAESEAEEAYLWIFERSPGHAAKWYHGLLRAVDSLSAHPERCPLAPESDAFGLPIRKLLYGKRSGVYRILFTATIRSSFSISVMRPAHPCSPSQLSRRTYRFTGLI